MSWDTKISRDHYVIFPIQIFKGHIGAKINGLRTLFRLKEDFRPTRSFHTPHKLHDQSFRPNLIAAFRLEFEISCLNTS